MALSEFELIARYFETPAFAAHGDKGVVLGIGDDAAILRVPAGRELVISIDTLVGGVHFPASFDPEDIGYRALAVNLSDLAAMGAEPLWFTLALTLPSADERWLEGFSRALAELAGRAGIALVGGDTTQGPLSITVQVHGAVPEGTALRRDGARPGDRVYVSGCPGRAALGLQCILRGTPCDGAESRAFLRPEPRLALGQRLRGVATAAIDVSDGLLQDAGHIAERSDVAIKLERDRLPLAPALAVLPLQDAWRYCLAGGDDYELCFTAPTAHDAEIQDIANELGVPCTAIGEVRAGSGACCPGVELPRTGYRHF